MKEFFSNVAQLSANLSQNLFGERLRLGRKALKQGREVVGLYGLFIMYCRMSRVAPDKRLYKELYMLHRQIPGVVIYDNVVFLPQDLLASMVPPPPGSIKLEDLTAPRTAYVQSVDRDLGPIAMAAYRHGCDWLVQLEDSMASMVRGVDLYKSSLSTGELLVEGVLIAHQNGYLLRTYMNMHQHMQIPYRSADLQPLFMLIELQHTVRTVHKQSPPQLDYQGCCNHRSIYQSPACIYKADSLREIACGYSSAGASRGGMARSRCG